MSLTCDSWIPVVRPYLSENLVDRQAMGRLRRLARHLPGDCLGVIEVRLGSGSGPVDFSLRLAEPAQAGRLAGQVSPPHLRAFLSRWSQEPGELAPVSSVWLEFDLDHEPREAGPWADGPLPVPVLCAKLRDQPGPGWLVDVLLPAMHGRPLSPAQRRLVRRCVDEIPPGGQLLYVFGLLSRPGDGLRLELYGLEPAAMIEYLGRVAQADAPQQVSNLAHLVEGSDRFHLSFDIAHEIGPRIGIECAFARLPDRESRWADLFDRLVASGLCTRKKRDAIFDWPGYDSLWTATDRWPDDGVGLGGYCVRCLSHVKLVSGEGRDPEAKVYLLFQHLILGELSSRVAPQRSV